MNLPRFATVAVASAAAVTLAAGPALAAVTFDEAAGTGFVGKGDVQMALELNNKQLQDQAGSFVFEYSSKSESETTWTCDKNTGPQTQERTHTSKTTTKGVVSTVERDNKRQITGFRLAGFGDGLKVNVVENGPAVGSCATGWTAIDLVQGDSVLTGGGLSVNGVSLQ